MVIFLQMISSFILLTITENESVTRWFTYDAPFFRAENFGLSLRLAVTWAVVVWDTKFSHVTIVSKVLNNWTTIYIPLAVAWIVCFYREVGWLSKLTRCRALVWTGRNSMYFFLIHYVVYLYFRKFLDLQSYGWAGRLAIATCIAILTVLFTFLYQGAEKRVEEYWNNRQKLL